MNIQLTSNQHLVSCIIIFLNEETYLEEAIESVFSQTYPYWELLLVDDGSCDRSPQIAQAYATKYPDRVRYLTHPNRQNMGMSASRNLGIQQAKGTYISYLDGDDIWLPNKLSDQVALLDTHPEVALLDCPLLCWYSWTGEPEDQNKDHLYGVGDNALHPFGDQVVQPPELVRLFLEDEQFIPSGGMVRRDILLQVGGGEPSFRTSYEDAIVWFKVGLVASAYISNHYWYQYRIHPQSCERQAAQRGLAEVKRLRYLNWAKQYLHSQSIQDFTVRQSLRTAIWRARWRWFKAQIKRRMLNQIYGSG